MNTENKLKIALVVLATLVLGWIFYTNASLKKEVKVQNETIIKQGIIEDARVAVDKAQEANTDLNKGLVEGLHQEVQQRKNSIEKINQNLINETRKQALVVQQELLIQSTWDTYCLTNPADTDCMER